MTSAAIRARSTTIPSTAFIRPANRPMRTSSRTIRSSSLPAVEQTALARWLAISCSQARPRSIPARPSATTVGAIFLATPFHRTAQRTEALTNSSPSPPPIRPASVNNPRASPSPTATARTSQSRSPALRRSPINGAKPAHRLATRREQIFSSPLPPPTMQAVMMW